MAIKLVSAGGDMVDAAIDNLNYLVIVHRCSLYVLPRAFLACIKHLVSANIFFIHLCLHIYKIRARLMVYPVDRL
jgi:hypothetical protein